MAFKSHSNSPPQTRPTVSPVALPWIICGTAVAIAVTISAPHIWLVLLSEGIYSIMLLAAAAGWGAWPTAWLGFGRRPAVQQFCLALGLGLGILAVSTLCLGAAGLLNRPIAWTLLGIGGGLGLWRAYVTQQPAKPAPGDRIATLQLTLRTLALATLIPAAGVAIFGASLPPGLLWPAEAGGYDALEYHLQCPREYYEAGRIEFLPHNVYASFPQQMEMQYLLLMHLSGDLNRAAVSSQILHALCGLFALVAIAAWQPPGWGRLAALLAAGGVGWLAYLGCLAYVELGVLLFAALAAGVMIDHFGSGGSMGWRAALTAGLLAGLAGGCKYTALALIAAALAVAWTLTLSGSVKSRVCRLSFFALGVIAAFSPWLIRNAAFTGNPVFPFAYEWFAEWIDADVWSAEQAAQWETGHRFKADGNLLTARAAAVYSQLLSAPHFGLGIFLAAICGAWGRRSRQTVMLSIWALLMLAIWAFATHMPGRFIVPIVVPLAMLAGGIPRLTPTVRISVIVLVSVSVLTGGLRLAWELYDLNLRSGRVFSALIGATDLMSESHYVNSATPPDASVWLVGEARGFYVRRKFHYTVVFNRDPWIEAAQKGLSPADCVDWLRRRGVTHVVFSWPEIDRLRSPKNYGFSDRVDRAWVVRLVAAGLKPVLTPEFHRDVKVYKVARE